MYKSFNFSMTFLEKGMNDVEKDYKYKEKRYLLIQ